jgi:hypothetical protein
MWLESAIATFIANLEGENRAPDTIRKYRLLFRELQGFAYRHRLSTVAQLNFERLVAFRKTWTQQGAQTRNKQLDRLKAFFSTCHDAGWIAQNPTRKISRRARRTACRTLLPQTSRRKIETSKPRCSNLEFRESQSSKALIHQPTVVSYSLFQEVQIHGPQICHSIEPCASFKNGDRTGYTEAHAFRCAPRPLFINQNKVGGQRGREIDDATLRQRRARRTLP